LHTVALVWKSRVAQASVMCIPFGKKRVKQWQAGSGSPAQVQFQGSRSQSRAHGSR